VEVELAPSVLDDVGVPDRDGVSDTDELPLAEFVEWSVVTPLSLDIILLVDCGDNIETAEKEGIREEVSTAL